MCDARDFEKKKKKKPSVSETASHLLTGKDAEQ
jgi:hypothetical protein